MEFGTLPQYEIAQKAEWKNTVWNFREFSLTHFYQNFGENNGFTK